MLTVSHDPDAVESQLFGRELICPACRGSLKPWGFGVQRLIRCEVPVVNRRYLPRRARCGECGSTHILLPAVLAARRADHAEVIADAVELSAVEGLGFRKIAMKLDRPESTVRGWLRDFRTNAPAIAAAFAARVHRATAESLGFWPAPAITEKTNAWAMLMAHALVLAYQYRWVAQPVVTVPWQYAALFAHGPWFFSKVGWPEQVQHQLALPRQG
ncbi:DUF6431 domain-containing protein [Arthrobacter sp. LAPM80]